MSSDRTPADHTPVCAIVHLKPGSLPVVREWAHYMGEHRQEALESLRSEGVSIESIFLGSMDDVHFLVYYMRSASIEQAQEVARNATTEIESYHRGFKKKAWASVEQMELLLDLQCGPD